MTHQSTPAAKKKYSLLNKQVHIITEDLTMAQYFALLLVLCLSVDSLATTTKPQVQQETSTCKDLCGQYKSTTFYLTDCNVERHP